MTHVSPWLVLVALGAFHGLNPVMGWLFAVALGLCALVNLLPMPERFQGMVMTWQSGAIALVTLVLVGVVTSTYPARRAAMLPPVEALRYET